MHSRNQTLDGPPFAKLIQSFYSLKVICGLTPRSCRTVSVVRTIEHFWLTFVYNERIRVYMVLLHCGLTFSITEGRIDFELNQNCVIAYVTSFFKVEMGNEPMDSKYVIIHIMRFRGSGELQLLASWHALSCRC